MADKARTGQARTGQSRTGTNAIKRAACNCLIELFLFLPMLSRAYTCLQTACNCESKLIDYGTVSQRELFSDTWHVIFYIYILERDRAQSVCLTRQSTHTHTHTQGKQLA